jgi:YggT family protein
MFSSLYQFIWYGVAIGIMGIIVLMLLRLIVTYADLNPFSRTALSVRNWSDPLVNPVRRALTGYGVDPKYAPLIVVLIAILLGWFALQLVQTVLFTLGGVIVSAQRRDMISLVGFLLYGLLAVYSLLIFIRIVCSWGLSPRNRLMHFLLRVTEPVLAPFRRFIPPLGMFDISAIVVLLLLRLLQEAIAGTLIR